MAQKLTLEEALKKATGVPQKKKVLRRATVI